MSFFKWSKLAASNGSADPSCPAPEGMGAPAVNDSMRGLMAAAAKFRDDISGAIVTGGTSTAYTVASNQGFTSLATDLNGQMIAFSPHVTNGATVTLSVDGLAAKPLRSSPGVELLAGSTIAGTPYIVKYSNADGAFYLQGFFGNPAFSTGDVKLTLKTAADPGWVMFNDGTLSDGLSILGATCRGNADTQALFTLLYNNVIDTWAPVFTSNGTGSTRAALGTAAAAFAAHALLQLPKSLGRALAVAGAGGGLTARALGQNLGEETHLLSIAETPAHNHGGNTGAMSANAVHSHTVSGGTHAGVGGQPVTGPSAANAPSGAFAIVIDPVNLDHLHSIASQGGGAAHNVMQPSSFLNVMAKL